MTIKGESRMKKRRAACITGLLFCLAADILAKSGTFTIPLVKEPRPGHTTNSMVEAKFTGEANGDPVWSITLPGRELTLEMTGGESIMPVLQIKADQVELASLQGSVSFRSDQQGETVEFPLLTLVQDPVPLPLSFKLVKSRVGYSVSDVDNTEWEEDAMGVHPATGSPRISIPVAGRWRAFVGNAYALGCPFEFRRGKGRLWLIDANLNGVFGDLCQDQKAGDLLIWRFERAGPFGPTGVVNGGVRLTPTVTIDDLRYEVVITRQAETIVMTFIR